MRCRRLSYRYARLSLPGEQWEVHQTARLGRSGVCQAQLTWRPSADVFETDRTIEVVVDLAGVDPESLDVFLYEDAVVIEGQRTLPQVLTGLFHRVEIRQGRFRVELPIPTSSALGRIETGYDRGLLQMSFPKSDTR